MKMRLSKIATRSSKRCFHNRNQAAVPAKPKAAQSAALHGARKLAHERAYELHAFGLAGITWPLILPSSIVLGFYGMLRFS